MKIAVMGAGAVGGYFGGLLAKNGQDVTLIARGRHLKIIQNRGLKVKSTYGDFNLEVKATDDPSAIGPVDLVVFGVKAYHVREAAQAMPPLVGEKTAVLSLQNGVDTEEILAEIIGRDKVLAGVAYIIADLVEPGLIQQKGSRRDIIFGELDGKITPRAKSIFEVLDGAGIPTTLTQDVQAALWSKFLFICAFSGITALTRLPIGPIRKCQATWDLYRGILEEVYQVGKALGVNLPADAVNKTLEATMAVNEDGKSSLQGDLEKGKPLEIDFLVGTVIRLGQQTGVATPFCQAVYAAIKIHDQA